MPDLTSSVIPAPDQVQGKLQPGPGVFVPGVQTMHRIIATTCLLLLLGFSSSAAQERVYWTNVKILVSEIGTVVIKPGQD